MIKFVNLGEKDAENLNFESPIVYSSDSLISSMSYSGPASKIEESTTFTSNFKDKLVGIKGLVSLGSTGGLLRNIHVYSRNAVRLDGIERICYLQQVNESLLVSEYSGNRGAKYSALYSVLVEELHNYGFNDFNGKFTFKETEIIKFVEVVNLIIDRRESGNYELIAVDDVDSIVIDKQRYHYFKAYWQPKALSDVNNCAENPLANDVEQAFRVLINHSKCCNNVVELNLLGGKIEKLGKIIGARIQNLEEFDELSSEL